MEGLLEFCIEQTDEILRNALAQRIAKRFVHLDVHRFHTLIHSLLRSLLRKSNVKILLYRRNNQSRIGRAQRFLQGSKEVRSAHTVLDPTAAELGDSRIDEAHNRLGSKRPKPWCEDFVHVYIGDCRAHGFKTPRQNEKLWANARAARLRVRAPPRRAIRTPSLPRATNREHRRIARSGGDRPCLSTRHVPAQRASVCAS